MICQQDQIKEKLELTDSIKQYNAVVAQLNKNISSLQIINKRQAETIKQLRRELSIARQEKGSGNMWAELDDSRDN